MDKGLSLFLTGTKNSEWVSKLNVPELLDCKIIDATKYNYFGVQKIEKIKDMADVHITGISPKSDIEELNNIFYLFNQDVLKNDNVKRIVAFLNGMDNMAFRDNQYQTINLIKDIADLIGVIVVNNIDDLVTEVIKAKQNTLS